MPPDPDWHENGKFDANLHQNITVPQAKKIMPFDKKWIINIQILMQICISSKHTDFCCYKVGQNQRNKEQWVAFPLKKKTSCLPLKVYSDFIINDLSQTFQTTFSGRK